MPTYIDPSIGNDTSSAPVATYDPATRTVGAGDQVCYQSLAHVALATYGADLVARGGIDDLSAAKSINVAAFHLSVYADETYHARCSASRVIDVTTTCTDYLLDGRPGAIIFESQAANVEAARWGGTSGQEFNNYNVEFRVASSSNTCLNTAGAGPQTVNWHNCNFVRGGTVLSGGAMAGSTFNFYNPRCYGTAWNNLGGITTWDGVTVNIYHPYIDAAAPSRLFAAQNSVGAGITMNVYNPLALPDGRDAVAANAASGTNVLLNAGTNSTVNVVGGIISNHARMADATRATNNPAGTVNDSSSHDGFIISEDSGEGYAALVFIDSRMGRSTVDEYLSNGDGRIYIRMVREVLESYGGHATWSVDDWYDYGNHLNPTFVTSFWDWVNAGHEVATQGHGSDSWSTPTPFAAQYVGAGANPRITVTITDDPDYVWAGTIVLETDSGVDATIQIGKEPGKVQFIGNPVVFVDRLYGTVDALADWVSVNIATFWDDTECNLLTQGTHTAVAGVVSIPFDVEARNQREIVDVLDMVENGGLLETGESVPGYGYRIRTFVFSPGGNMESYPDGISGSPFAVARAAGCTATVAEKTTGWQNYLHESGPFDGTLASSLGWTYAWSDSSIALPSGATTEAAFRSCARTWATFARNSNAGLVFRLPWNTPLSATQLGWFLDELVNECGINLVTVQELEALKGAGAKSESALQIAGSDGWGTAKPYWGATPNPVARNGEPRPNMRLDCGPDQSTSSPFHPANL